MAPLEIEAANSRNRTGSYKVVPTTRDRYQPFSRAFHEPARKLASTKRGGRDHATLSSKFCSSSVVHASEAGNAPTNLMGSRGRTTNSLSTLASELRKVNTKKTIQRPFLRPPVTTLGCEMLSPLRSLFPIRLHREICALHPRKEGCVKILLLGLGNRDANHLYRFSSSSNRRHLSFYVSTLGDIHPTVVTVCS